MRKWLNAINEGSDIKTMIHDFMSNNNRRPYEINDDLSVDVKGDFILKRWMFPDNIKELPFKLRNIYGNFQLNNLEITTLNNAPDFIENDFSIEGTNLTNLVGAPQEIGGTLFLSRCQNLTSLKGMPKTLKSVNILNCNNLSYWEARYILFSNLVNTKYFRINNIGLASFDIRVDSLKSFFNMNDEAKQDCLLHMLEMFKKADKEIT